MSAATEGIRLGLSWLAYLERLMIYRDPALLAWERERLFPDPRDRSLRERGEALAWRQRRAYHRLRQHQTTLGDP